MSGSGSSLLKKIMADVVNSDVTGKVTHGVVITRHVLTTQLTLSSLQGLFGSLFLCQVFGTSEGQK